MAGRSATAPTLPSSAANRSSSSAITTSPTPRIRDAGRLVRLRGARPHPALRLPPLVTTASDGDNGGWFRNTTPGSNFWSAFHTELIDRVRADQAGGLRPTLIADYLRIHGAASSVTVSPGAWNTGAHNGAGFVHWTGSAAQRAALQPVDHVTSPGRARRVQREGATTDSSRSRSRACCAPRRANLYWGGAGAPLGRGGCPADTRISTAPSGTLSRRPASSPDSPIVPPAMEERSTARVPEASQASQASQADVTREANLTRTQRPGEGEPAHPRRDRPPRL
jgi:hypothetical protein